MTTVRQTVTTVQSSHGPAPGLDNSLDALLEDLQSSVAARGGAPAVNGVSSSYRREMTRTLERDSIGSGGGGGRGGGGGGGGVQQVMHLAPANPTTVLSERSASPMCPGVSPGEARSVSYKTYSYQTYQTSSGGDARAATLPASPAKALTSSAAADPTSDARLQQNLHELDSLLVDLRHAQRAGFDPPPPAVPPSPQHLGSSTTTRTAVMTSSGDIDPGLLEPLSHSTPAPPARQQPHVSRALEYNTYRTERYTSSSADGRDHYGTTDSPRLQPKRSSSAQRELVYGVGEHVSRQRTRSPSPGTPQRREYVEARDRYREKSPSHQRLQRDVLYNESTTTTTTNSTSGGGSRSGSMRRYRDPSPPSRRPASPVAPHPHGADYPSGGSSRTVTTVRTYNYSVAASDAKAKEVKEAQIRAPTTNKAGPPVYYPPGVEMFAQKEEASMQMAGGAKAKGKYKYEYESKEKSKSSQSQGAAVVPVCLPLCCAMPCVIM